MLAHPGSVLADTGNFKVIDCTACGFVHVTPIPSDNELLSMYSKEFYQHMKPEYISKDESELEYWNLTFDDKLDVLEKQITSKSRRILDVGCGPGFFLMRAKTRGWDVVGIEPSEMAAEYAEKHGIRIIRKLFQDVDLESMGNFDAIHMKFFLEHSPSPVDVLQKCRGLLNDGGMIVIEVPNDYNPLQDTVTRILAKKEYWLAPPEHLNYFSFESLSNLLEKNGFRVVLKESTFPLELFLLMGHDYIGNDPVGRQKHSERMKMELCLNRAGHNEMKRKIYSFFASIGIGREAIIYGKKL